MGHREGAGGSHGVCVQVGAPGQGIPGGCPRRGWWGGVLGERVPGDGYPEMGAGDGVMGMG